MEKYRTRVMGVFFTEENAKRHAQKYGKGYFVEKHKILDADNYSHYGEAI